MHSLIPDPSSSLPASIKVAIWPDAERLPDSSGTDSRFFAEEVQRIAGTNADHGSAVHSPSA